MNLIKSFLLIFITIITNTMNSQTSIYDLSITGIDGKEIKISDFKNKNILFVNVASKCGFTGQYEGLQKLHEKYKSNLVVFGVPSNEFGGQEPGTSEQIATFCSDKYDVSFIMTEKVKVKGSEQHPLYKWLTNKDLNMVSNSSVKWNFQKYLINEKGEFVNYWYSFTKPLSEKITKYLK